MELEKIILRINQYTNYLYRQYSQSSENKILNNLSINEYYYLDALSRRTKASYSELADYLNYRKPSVTNMIDKLIKKGYVKKEQSSEDKRIYYLSLTDKGLMVIQIELEMYKNYIENVKEVLDDNEFDMYEAVLNKIFNEVIETSNNKF